MELQTKTIEKDTIELVRESIVGKQDALNSLCKRVEPALKSYVRNRVNNPEYVLDIVQDIMLILVRKLNTINEPACFWSWIYCIASNQIKKHFINIKRNGRTIASDKNIGTYLSNLAPDNSHDPALQALNHESIDAIMNSVKKLNKRARIILQMRCFDNEPYYHIAEHLNCSETAARVSLNRSRAKLRCELDLKYC